MRKISTLFQGFNLYIFSFEDDLDDDGDDEALDEPLESQQVSSFCLESQLIISTQRTCYGGIVSLGGSVGCAFNL